MQALTRALLDPLWPKADPALKDGIVANQGASFAVAEINTDLRLAHLMAQISHESGGAAVLQENLYYEAARLTKVWPSRFPNLAAALPYAHNPRALADKVYGGRMGNDPSPSNDGLVYSGAGLIGITGKARYRQVGAVCGLDLVTTPALVKEPASALLVACAVWKIGDCNDDADQDDLEGVTEKINGGLNGLALRRIWLGRWKVALNQT